MRFFLKWIFFFKSKQKVGTDSTAEILLLQDSLALMYGFFAILAVSYDILVLKIVAGMFLSLCVTGGHNFFHKKDNWRQFYFDLSPMSSYEWRLSHAISHHLYPNTVLVRMFNIYVTCMY